MVKKKTVKRKTSRKAKAKAKKPTKSNIKQTEITAKQQARKALNNPDLYKVYTKLLVIIKRASNVKEKSVKGSAITFWGNKAKAVLSANSKEVRLYYALGQKKRYRESPEQEGTLVFAHSSNLLTEGVQNEISVYLHDIFTKYESKEKEVEKDTSIAQVVDTFGEDVEDEKDSNIGGEEDE